EAEAVDAPHVRVDDQVLTGRQEDVVGAEQTGGNWRQLGVIVDEIVGVDVYLRGVQCATVSPHRHRAGRLKIETAGNIDGAIVDFDVAWRGVRRAAVKDGGLGHQADAVDRRIAVAHHEFTATNGERLAIANSANSAGGDRGAGDVSGGQRAALQRQIESVGDEHANLPGGRVAAIAIRRCWR